MLLRANPQKFWVAPRILALQLHAYTRTFLFRFSYWWMYARLALLLVILGRQPRCVMIQ